MSFKNAMANLAVRRGQGCDHRRLPSQDTAVSRGVRPFRRYARRALHHGRRRRHYHCGYGKCREADELRDRLHRREFGGDPSPEDRAGCAGSSTCPAASAGPCRAGRAPMACRSSRPARLTAEAVHQFFLYPRDSASRGLLPVGSTACAAFNRICAWTSKARAWPTAPRRCRQPAAVRPASASRSAPRRRQLRRSATSAAARSWTSATSPPPTAH